MSTPHPSAGARQEPASREEATFESLAVLQDLPPGTLLSVTLNDGTPICLFNNDGLVGAVLDCCTHNQFRMSEGVLHADGTIECIWHGARFDCRTGAVRRAPAFDPLAVYEVKIDGGTIFVGPRRSP